MKNRIILSVAVVLAMSFSIAAQSNDDITLHSAKFIGDTQFIVIDGDGLHAHPFLIAVITFTGIPIDGDQFTVGAATFTFRDTASEANDIQIESDIDATLDHTRDHINDAHVVLRTSRTATTITLVLADTAGIALTTTSSYITVTGFNSCGAP